MLRYIQSNDLNQFPTLADSMFRDRADQFKRRLNWEVSIDAQGYERDEYDDLDPLYVIWEQPDGRHGGSMRFLPTTGRTMVNEHFSDLMDGRHVSSPHIWECTRFCLAPGATGQIAAALMLAGGELLQAFNLTHFVGVFDQRMVRIYRRIGASPEVLGQSAIGRDQICIGLWDYNAEAHARVLTQAEIAPEQSEHWLAQSLALPAKTARKAQMAA